MRRTSGSVPPASPPRRPWLRIALGCLASAALLGAASPRQSAPSQNVDKPYQSPETARPADKSAPSQVQQIQTNQGHPDQPISDRKRQITDESARLLELARQLKSEVDKTDKDTLSINVIRKAETIEKLAKGVKEKMKLTIGGN